MGTIYLIHFTEHLEHAGHYIGYTARDLEDRIADHLTGRGAKLMAAVVAAGISFEVVRTWQGDAVLEQRLKNLGGAARLCPVCNPGTTQGTFKHVARASRWERTRGKTRRYLMNV